MKFISYCDMLSMVQAHCDASIDHASCMPSFITVELSYVYRLHVAAVPGSRCLRYNRLLVSLQC